MNWTLLSTLDGYTDYYMKKMWKQRLSFNNFYLLELNLRVKIVDPSKAKNCFVLYYKNFIKPLASYSNLKPTQFQFSTFFNFQWRNDTSKSLWYDNASHKRRWWLWSLETTTFRIICGCWKCVHDKCRFVRFRICPPFKKIKCKYLVTNNYPNCFENIF